MGGFSCSANSRCPCPPGKVVTRVTAFGHFRDAQRLENRINKRNPRVISPPKAVTHENFFEKRMEHEKHFASENRYPYVQHNIAEAVSNPYEDEEADEKCMTSTASNSQLGRIREGSTDDISQKLSDESFVVPPISKPSYGNTCTESVVESSQSHSSSHEAVLAQTPDVPGAFNFESFGNSFQVLSANTGSPKSSQLPSSDHELGPSDDDERTEDNFRFIGLTKTAFERFMRDHAFIIGLAVKHGHVTTEIMNDLLVERGCLYTSWNGVRKALLRESNLPIEMLPFCSKGHKALQQSSEYSDTNRRCDVSECMQFPAPISHFSYIGLKDRMVARLRNNSSGPALFQYYHEQIDRKLQTVEGQNIIDFTSGTIFRELVKKLGGLRCVRYDIFLALSTDGVSAFKKTEYSYWPVVLMILNLHPSERFKVHNMVPVSIIPGPNAPSDLVSFLTPLLHELESMKQGITVTLWDGVQRTVRFHLIYVLSDLAALKKLTGLKGHNALVPCRFCFIRGVYVPERRHVYFPPFVYEEVLEIQRRRNLWNPNKLPLRTPLQYKSSIANLQASKISLSSKEMKRRCQDIGVGSPVVCKLIQRLETLQPFHGFPIDLMHLLFENIAQNVVSIWCGDYGDFDDICVLRNKSSQVQISHRLREAGRLYNNRIRRPRDLAQRGRWKATEWKAFVLELSLIVLDGIVPENLMSGWSVFVELCKILCRWRLSENEIRRIGYLSKRFYSHFTTTYYNGMKDRIHFCKYVYHLLLHLEDSTRACGPLSLLSQWGMENFVGTHNRRCNATNKFAESVMEKIKLAEAASMYCLQNEMALPLIDSGLDEVRSTLLRQSNQEQLDGFCFRHPRKQLSVGEVSRATGIDFRLRLLEYYVRNTNIDINITDSDHVMGWSRLIDDKAEDGFCTLYSCTLLRTSEESKRAACYAAGTFQGGKEDKIDIYYGKVILFFEHFVNDADVDQFLCLVGWVSKGLQKGNQKQVYKIGFDTEGSVFTVYSVESVVTLSRQIAIVEQKVSTGRNRLQKRTYFVDSLRDSHMYKSVHISPKHILCGF